MGKSSGSKPAAPDPYATAAAQGQQDRLTSAFNINNSRVNTSNPFGTTSWQNNRTFDQGAFDQAMAAYKPGPGGKPGTPGTYALIDPVGYYSGLDRSAFNFNAMSPGGSDPTEAPAASPPPSQNDYWKDNWTNTATLNDASQGIFDSATGGLQSATDALGAGAGGEMYNDKIAKALYERSRFLTDPADELQRNEVQSNLADRGFNVQDMAANTAYKTMYDEQGRLRGDQANAAVLAGGAEARSNLSTQAQIAQQLSALRQAQMAGVTGQNANVPVSPIGAPDLSGNITKTYEDQLNAYNAQAASKNQLTGTALTAAAKYFA